jgi:type IV secretory pathway ATPase VirB11/archaellum biosynthesis ATPase
MIRIVNYLRENVANDTVDEITIDSPSASRIYPSNQVALIREISRTTARFREEINAIKKGKFEPKCPDSHGCSRFWRQFTRKISDEDFVSSDPIRAYIVVLAAKRFWNGRKQKCLRCRRDCLSLLERLRRVLLGSTVVSRFLDLKLNYDMCDRETVYNQFFQPLSISRPQSNGSDEPAEESRKVEEYNVGPYTVKITVYRGSGENAYTVSSLVDQDSSLRRVLAEATTHAKTVPQISPRRPKFYNLDELLQARQRETLRIIKERFPEVSQPIAVYLAQLSGYESTGVGTIAPFLIDEQVEELFVDQPGAPIYLDHRKWGRCRTNTIPSVSELKRIETRLRAESGFRLDRLNPSIKTEISTRDFNIRASLDISPLAVDGFHLDIRKMERNRFSLAALVENNTLSLEAASYLYFCVLRKRNIVAIGEPGSGKTTIINALDLLTPSHWRKIAVEDTIESIPQREFGKHQVRLKVEPFEEKKRFQSKGREIVSLLHRTPDFVYLGEIQTASHSKAMFHALSAGLTGLQTCHADSPEQVMVRWVIHHNIPPVCLRQIGIVVHLKKVGASAEGVQMRKVVRICEVKGNTETDSAERDFSSTSVQLVDVFRWNPSSDLLEQEIDLFETPSLQSIRIYEALSRSMFEKEIAGYRSILKALIQASEIDVTSTTSVFDEIFKKRDIARNDTFSDSMVAQQK